MKEAYGLSVPTTIEEVVVPSRCALIVYDMQAGVVGQIDTGAQIVSQCQKLLTAARAGGFRIFFTRHLFLPNAVAGVGQLRRAMIWQNASEPSETQPLFEQGSPAYQIVPELAPQPGEVALDKITMSAFDSTFLDIALRDAQIEAFVIAGIALEIGIEPTVRHALDRNYIPLLVTDACGSRTDELKQRSLETLKETGEILLTTTDAVTALLSKPSAKS